MTSSAKTAVATKINKLRSLKNMTPADVRSALTGKANASVAELKKAYEQIMNSNIHDVETRLLLERAFAVGATETV